MRQGHKPFSQSAVRIRIIYWNEFLVGGILIKTHCCHAQLILEYLSVCVYVCLTVCLSVYWILCKSLAKFFFGSLNDDVGVGEKTMFLQKQSHSHRILGKTVCGIFTHRSITHISNQSNQYAHVIMLNGHICMLRQCTCMCLCLRVVFIN